MVLKKGPHSHKEDCHDRDHESAFRAVSNNNLPVPPNTAVKVLYQVEQFDLNNEYYPSLSAFIPKETGVYLIIASITFSPDNSSLNYRARVDLRVNGQPETVVDNDFFGGGSQFANVVSVSAILLLQEGDTVEVFAQSDIEGDILSNNAGTHFEAARIARVE